MDTVLVLGIMATALIVLAVAFRFAYAYLGLTPFTVLTGLGSIFMFTACVLKLAGLLEWNALVWCCVIYMALTLPGVLGSIVSNRVFLWYLFGSGNNCPIKSSLIDHGEYGVGGADDLNLPDYMQEN